MAAQLTTLPRDFQEIFVNHPAENAESEHNARIAASVIAIPFLSGQYRVGGDELALRVHLCASVGTGDVWQCRSAAL